MSATAFEFNSHKINKMIQLSHVWEVVLRDSIDYKEGGKLCL